MYYSDAEDPNKIWTIEKLESAMGKPSGYWKNANPPINFFTEGIVGFNLNFDNMMKFHFTVHGDPWATIGLDLLMILLSTLPVLLLLIPTFGSFIFMWIQRIALESTLR